MRGHLRLLYVSLERPRDPRFRTYLERLYLLQLGVAEACYISTLGHGLHPDGFEIAHLLPAGRNARSLPIHALTAPATRSGRVSSRFWESGSENSPGYYA